MLNPLLTRPEVLHKVSEDVFRDGTGVYLHPSKTEITAALPRGIMATSRETPVPVLGVKGGFWGSSKVQ